MGEEADTGRWSNMHKKGCSVVY